MIQRRYCFSFLFCSYRDRLAVWLILLPSSSLTLSLPPPDSSHLPVQAHHAEQSKAGASWLWGGKYAVIFISGQSPGSSPSVHHNEMMLWISCLSYLLKNKRAESVSSGALKSLNALFWAKSHYIITDFQASHFSSQCLADSSRLLATKRTHI